MSGHVTSADTPCTIRPEQMRPGRHRALAQALRMQEVLYLTVLSDEASGQEKAQAARAWEALEERKRILRGRPLPGSKRPAPDKPKPHKAAAVPSFTEEP
jgi:hypothetical protein